MTIMDKRLLAPAVAAALVGVLAGCGGSGTSASLTGRVTDTGGAAIQGVTVSLVSPVAGPTTVTDASGRFTLGGMPSGQTVILRANKDGYVSETSYPIPVTQGHSSEYETVLVRVGTSMAVDATVENVVTHTRPDGIRASVRLPARSIVNSAGLPVASAVVHVTVIPIDPEGDECRPEVIATRDPGEDKPAPLIATPAVAVDLKDAAGNELKLDPTKPATIEFPIVPSSDPGKASVGLWAQKALPASWVEEGTATRDDTVSPPVYRAQVTHFSQFVSGTRGPYTYTAIITVYNDPTIPSPVPVPGAYVKAVDLGAGIIQVGTADANGIVMFSMPGTRYYIRSSKLGHTDRGVYSTVQHVTIISVAYWLQKITTGGSGS
jgi:hypothetical protein